MTFNELTERRLRNAGWLPGRRVDALVGPWIAQLESEGFELSEAAKTLLWELGGLRVEQTGRGLDHWLEPFSFTPLDAVGEVDYVKAWAEKLGTSLFPVGSGRGGASLLYVTPGGHMVELMTNGWIIGDTVPEGLDTLVTGRAGRKI